MRSRTLMLALLLTAALPCAAGAMSKEVDKAQALFDQKDYKSALSAFSQIAAKDSDPRTPDGEYSLMMSGLCHEALGDLPKAEKALDDYATRGVKDGGAGYYYLGTVLDKQGQREKASWAYKQALAAEQRKPWVERLARARLGDQAPRQLKDLAQDLYGIGEHDLARQAFERVAEKSPKTKDGAYARMMVALSYSRLNDPAKTEAAFRAYLTEYEPSGAGLFYFGQFLMGHGKADEAWKMFKRAAAAPDCPDWAKKEAQEALNSRR